jgi:hypothetical protein
VDRENSLVFYYLFLNTLRWTEFLLNISIVSIININMVKLMPFILTVAECVPFSGTLFYVENQVLKTVRNTQNFLMPHFETFRYANGES